MLWHSCRLSSNSWMGQISCFWCINGWYACSRAGNKISRGCEMSFLEGVSNTMINDLLISNPTQADVKAAYQIFETAISDAFEKEGLGFLREEIHREITHKKYLLDASLDKPDSDIYFLIAKQDETVVGTISFGPCGEDIKKCTENQLQSVGELGSLYILPGYQGQGVGSALINAMVAHLSKQGIDQFCLDSGYKRAQKRWLRKFGVPYKVVKNYWGPDSDHMIWLCKVIDFIKE